ncbi:MAG: prepilin peptidase [Syntrophaceae bacterium]
MDSLSTYTLLTIFLIACSIHDLLYFRIPNYLTFTSIPMFFIFHLIYNGFDGVLFAFSGLAIGILLLLPLYLLKMMGAGDVKLMGSIGAALGFSGAVKSFLFSAIAGGVYAVIVLALNHAHRVRLFHRFALMLKTLFIAGNFAYIPPDEEEKKAKLCYGVAIAAGTISYMFFEYAGYPSWALFLSRL